MKKIIVPIVCFGALAAFAANLQNPAFRMTEAELLAVLKENGLNDKVTACQELSHKGTAACVPQLAALLKDATEPPLFHAARCGLLNIPGAEAESALAAACASVTNHARRAALEATLRERKSPVPAGYAGATAVLTTPPAKTALQKGDLSVFPALVDAASGTGFDATLARRHLIGFPNEGVVGKLLELAEGNDVKKARVAIDVLGERVARAALPRLIALIRNTKEPGVRNEVFKALVTLCNGDDMPMLLGLLKDFPKEDRLAGSIIRIAAREFWHDTSNIKLIKSEYGWFGDEPKFVDNTDVVRPLVEGGSGSIMASNRIAVRGGFPCDIAPCKVKELHMVYRIGNGPERTAIVRETTEFEIVENRLPDKLSKRLVDACKAATGDEKAALKNILSALDRRGVVPGADTVLFRPIFNGRDLTGWSQKDGFFTVRDGVITGESTAAHPCRPNHHLVYTAEELSDFELCLEFRLSRNANSGIQLRCLPQFIGDNGYQADLNGDGGIVGFIYHPRQFLIGERGADVEIDANGKKQVKRFADGKALQKVCRVGDWNSMRVKVEGRTMTVWINDVRTTSVTDPRPEFLPAKGQIALQLHQGPPMKVEFRNLRIR